MSETYLPSSAIAVVESVFLDLRSIDDLLLDLADANLLNADCDTNNQNSNRCNYLSYGYVLPKNKNIREHRVDDIYKAHKRDEACIAALEGNCLTHDTNRIQASGAK